MEREYMYNEKTGRHWMPIGPAPEGWQQIDTCSCVIPHIDESEAWMNDDMNLDHYTGLVFVVQGELIYDYCPVLGGFTSFHDAVDFVKVYAATHPDWYEDYVIQAFVGGVEVRVPDNWRDAINWTGRR